MVTDTLVVVRRAQLESRRAKIRARQMKNILTSEEYNNLILSLETIDNILERIAVRLETILASGIVTSDLLVIPRSLIEKASESLQDLPPELAQSLAEIGDMLEVMVSEAPSPQTDVLFVAEPAAKEAEKILEEARREARKKLAEETPL